MPASAAPPPPTPLTVKTVVRWIRPTKKIQYHFGETGQSTADHRYIPGRFLFQDDTRIDTLTKLYVFLEDYYAGEGATYANEWVKAGAGTGTGATPEKRQDLPIVAWRGTQGFLVQPETPWEAWTANPWKLKGLPDADAVQQALAALPQSPIHESLATQLTQTDTFAFVCWMDCPLFAKVPLLKRWYGLYNDTKALLTRGAVLEQTRILTDLVRDSATVPLQNEWLDEYNEMGVFSLKHIASQADAPPKVLFNLLPVSATVPLVQWKEGKFQPALYRLYKHHALDVASYTSLEKIPLQEQRVQIVYTAPYKNQPVVFKLILVFGKTLHYYIHTKAKDRVAEVEWLESQVVALKRHIAQFSNDYRLRFDKETTHLKARYILGAPFAIQKTHWSPFGWLFHIQKAPGASASTTVLTYLRSANSHQRLDPETFIQSQSAFLDDELELIRVIGQTFMVPESKAREMLQEYKDGRELTGAFAHGKRRSWVEIPATVSVIYQPLTKQLLVQCDRFLNSDDLNRMLVWMRGALAQMKPKPVAVAPPSPSKPPVFAMDDSPDVLLSSSSASASSSSSAALSSSASASSAAASSSSARSAASSLLGGRRQGQRGGTFDLIESLKQADPEIFTRTRLPNNTSRYPRLCSANTNQQPVVVSQDEMKRIDASEYKTAYDSKLLYGSDKDPKNHHYYFCPRIWCPISKVPLTPQQYEDLGHRCPAPHSEEPWLFYDADYWGRDASVPHHIGFHKKQGTNNLCLPCCKRFPEKDTGIKKCSAHVSGQGSVVPPVPSPPSPSVPPPQPPSQPRPPQAPDEDYYLLHFAAPISAKRWGVIPEALHQTLKPNQLYSHCYNQLKTDPSCLVRKGIHHHRDSLLNALGYIFTQGTGGKREWLAHLEAHFTPMEFLRIHNGWGVSNFLDPTPILPQTHIGLVLKWREWIQTWPAYIRAFGLESIVKHAALIGDASTTDQLRLSRELAIYVAWRRFWDYLKSSEPKNIYLIYDLVYAVFHTRLVVWEKQGDDVYLTCPLGATETHYRSVQDDAAPYAMVLYENAYYEPVELKARGAPGIQVLHDPEIKEHLTVALRACAGGGAAATETSLQSYVLLRTLPELLTAAWLAPKRLVVAPSMTVVGVLLAGGVFVQWKHPVPLRYVKELQTMLGVKSLVYLEDLESTVVSAPLTVPTHHASAYMRLLKDLGLKWNVKTIAATGAAGAAAALQSVLTFKPIAAWENLGVAVIPTGTLTHAEEVRMIEISKQGYWTRLQRDIGNKLLRHYAKLAPAFAKGGLEGVLRLPPFQPLNPRDSLQVLEEIPLVQSKKIIPKDTLYEWFIAIGTTDAYPIFTSQVKEGFGKNEWMFSQSAVQAGLPAPVRVPAKSASLPKRLPPEPIRVIGAPGERGAPPFALPQAPVEGEWATLPNKWLQKKHYGWDAYRRAPVGLREGIAWLLNAYGIALPMETMAVVHSMKVAELLNADDTAPWEQYLQDPSVWRALAKRLELPKSKMATVLKTFLKLPRADQWNHWEALAAQGLPAMDLDLWVFAHLTHSVVLMLHRSPSGKGVETGERHRFQDFVSSATVFHPEGLREAAFNTLPLVVFFKEAKIDAVQSTYFWVKYTPIHKKYFASLNDAPETLKRLIHAVRSG